MMNKKQVHILLYLIFLFLGQKSYSQACKTPLDSHLTCYGTKIVNLNASKPSPSPATSRRYYIDRTTIGTSLTTCFTGFTVANLTAYANDTIRICDKASVEITNPLANTVIIVESGASVTLSNGTLSGTIYNYGSVVIQPMSSRCSNSTNLSINSAGALVNASTNAAVYVQNNNISNQGVISNYGLIANITTLNNSSSSAQICVGNGSVIKAVHINNSNNGGAYVTPSGSQPVGGCIQYSGTASGSCLTTDATTGPNITFCGASPASPSSCGGGLPAYFGTALHPGGCSTCNSPLPITLVYFTAKKTLEGVHLSWETAAQWDSDHFIIEHSTDGLEWATVGSLPTSYAQGAQRYSLLDRTPEVGDNYYRLVEVSTQGKREIYKTVYVEIADNFSGFSVYPNPSSGELNLMIFGSAASYNFEIVDLSGKSILRKKAHPGTNALDQLVTVAGVYIAKLKVGHNYYAQKLVIQ